MGILLFLTSTLFTFLLLVRNEKMNLPYSILLTILTIGGFVTFSSELLSVFHLFNYYSIFAFWGAICILLSILLFRKNKKNNLIHDHLALFWVSLKKEKGFLILFLSVFSLLFIQGVVYPPNNWDSLTYHMARIPHWVDNQSIATYPTHIYRQLYSSPFSELLIAQVCILVRSDIFANSIQLFFLIGSLAAFVCICTEFDLARRSKIIGCIFLLFTPDILLQATSTQNDLVVSFFILCSILFCVKTYKNFDRPLLFLLSLSIGLALYTKGTAYIILLPILLFWGVRVLKKDLTFGSLLKMGFLSLCIIIVNSGYYYRNYSLSGDIFGKNEDRVFNEEMSLKKLTLNVSKNIGVHFAIYPLNEYYNQLNEKMHLVFKESMKNPAINFNGHGFKLKNWQHHEDDASNFFQMVLIFICIPLFLLHRKKHPLQTWLLLFLPILILLLFSAVLKWQPWITRLQLPIFFLFSFFVALVLNQGTIRKKVNLHLLHIFSIVTILYGLLLIAVNPTRPFITNSLTNKIYLGDSQLKKYCANYPPYASDFSVARSYLKNHEGKVGIDIGEDTWEYPLYFDIFSKHQKLAVPINVRNHSKKKASTKNQDVNYIISSKVDSLYHYNGLDYTPVKKMKLFTIYGK